jgi:hypothetical protein
MTAPVLAESSLGALEQIGRGGQGVVYRAPEAALPGVTGRLVFKRYHEEWLDGRQMAVAHSIGRLIDLRQAPGGRSLDTHATWPMGLVTADGNPGSAVGILLRELPSTCFVQTVLFTQTKRTLWEVSRQLQSPQDLAARGLPVLTDVELLTLVVRLARFAAFLHHAGVVIGDLSGRNVVLRRDAHGSVHPMLVDTDGCRLVGQGAHFPQGNTPDWEAPESLAASAALERLRSAGGGDTPEAARLAAQANVQNLSSDVYKVALLVLRLFHEGTDHTLIRSSQSATRRLRSLLGSQRAAVVTDGLDEAATARPSMGALARALAGTPA